MGMEGDLGDFGYAAKAAVAVAATDVGSSSMHLVTAPNTNSIRNASGSV